jgi:putative ABC transport system ATP-binding protein
MKPVIALDELTYQVETAAESITVLRQVSLTVDPGEFLVITGPSGSGKTSLLRIMAGLIESTSGEVIVCDKQLVPLSDDVSTELRRKDISMVFQSNNLSKYLTLSENIELALENKGISKSDAKSLAFDALGKVGISDLAKRFPDESSGGQQQRAGIARAIASKSQVLLCDEPSGSLDSENSKNLGELLLEISKSGTTVVVATHDPILESFATRVVTMRDGEFK